MPPPVIFGPDPMLVEGHRGARYWIHEHYPFTGIAPVDERLSGYPVAVFQPHHRPPAETPVVIGLQGICAPYLWNSFLVSTLMEMGIATVLFETPFAGERSLVRNGDANIVEELTPLLDHNYLIKGTLLESLMQGVSRDMRTVIKLLEDRHGLTSPRRALFGVSLGTLLSSYAFMKEGIGERLLGTIGHANLVAFARSYTPFFAPLILALPSRVVHRLGRLILRRNLAAGLDFLAMLRELSGGEETFLKANPMTYADQVQEDRLVHFLVGDADPVVRTEDALACASHFKHGECYIVPGLGHGISVRGPSFIEHVRYYLATQLGDWRG